MLVSLAAIWGSSFLFIKVGVRHLAPETLVFGRLVFAVAALALFLPFRIPYRDAWRSIRENLVPLAIVALFNAALPFYLLSWAETRLDSGFSALLPACTPLFP